MKTIKDKKERSKLFRTYIIRLLGYMVILPFAWIKGSKTFMEVLIRNTVMIGRTMAFFNVRYEEYKEIHGE